MKADVPPVTAPIVNVPVVPPQEVFTGVNVTAVGPAVLLTVVVVV